MSISITPPQDYGKRELAASDEIKAILTALREEVGPKNWTFDVGYTTAIDFEIDQISGLKVPEDFLKVAKKQNKIARTQVKVEQKPLFLGKCAAGEAKFSWKDQGKVTPPRDQGACGSCWAFATHGAFEGSFAILNDELVDSAEQDTLDCSGSGSCGGGWWAHQYLIDTGSAKEADYAYMARKDSCRPDVERPYKAVAWGYVDSSKPIPTVESLKAALCEYGPLAVAVEVTHAFQAYTGGVFNEQSNGNVNHGVTLIGWDDSKEAWQIKNSWGTGWGESGFMWIAYNSNSIGYGASWVQADVMSICQDGPTLIAYEEFIYPEKKQYSSNANVASLTFNLPREMYVSIVADASATLIDGSPPKLFKTGLYNSASPGVMWTAAMRKGSFQAANQYLQVHTSFALKLPAGTHTIYWKIWLGRYTMQFDCGTLTAIAVPCTMGGKLKVNLASHPGLATAVADEDGFVTTKDAIRPDLDITLDQSGTDQ